MKLLYPSEVYCGDLLCGSDFGDANLEYTACIIIANCAPYGDEWQQIPLHGQSLQEYEKAWVNPGYLEYIGENPDGDGYIFEPTIKFVAAVSAFPATEEKINSEIGTYSADDQPIRYGAAKVQKLVDLQ